MVDVTLLSVIMQGVVAFSVSMLSKCFMLGVVLLGALC